MTNSVYTHTHTADEVEHLGLHVLEQQAYADGGEVAVGHLLVPQHALQQPLQVSLRRLQALATPRQVGDVRSSLPKAHTHTHTHTHRNTYHHIYTSKYTFIYTQIPLYTIIHKHIHTQKQLSIQTVILNKLSSQAYHQDTHTHTHSKTVNQTFQRHNPYM